MCSINNNNKNKNNNNISYLALYVRWFLNLVHHYYHVAVVSGQAKYQVSKLTAHNPQPKSAPKHHQTHNSSQTSRNAIPYIQYTAVQCCVMLYTQAERGLLSSYPHPTAAKCLAERGHHLT